MYRFGTTFRLVAVIPTPGGVADRLTTQVAKARRIADHPLEDMTTLVNCVGEKGQRFEISYKDFWEVSVPP